MAAVLLDDCLIVLLGSELASPELSVGMLDLSSALGLEGSMWGSMDVVARVADWVPCLPTLIVSR